MAVPGVGERRLAKELADRLLAEAGNGQDALEVLASIQRRVARQLPEWRQTEDCNQCGRVAPALNTFRESLSGASLLDFDSAVTLKVAGSRSKINKWGVRITKEKWQQAKAKQDGMALPSKRGRPAKMADAALVKRVIDCIMAHSQESSIWLRTQACHGRTMTTSLLRAYWDSDLPTSLGWAQFHRMVRAKCKWLLRAARKTDYCDYCHLYESSILPGICKLMKQAQTSLTELLPSYFHSYAEPVDGDSITKLEAMSRYIRLRSERQQADRRAYLKPLGRQKLREVEASVGRQMAWELKVAKSSHWRWQVAKRQSRAMQAALDSLSAQQVLLWSDFKQNLSVPRARAETGDMFYGTSRVEITCWGCLVFQKKGDAVRTKHIIVLSSVIEHSSLV